MKGVSSKEEEREGERKVVLEQGEREGERENRILRNETNKEWKEDLCVCVGGNIR